MNAFDRVMLAAAAGVAPDDEDLEAVKPTPGVEQGQFERQVMVKAAEIVRLRQAGNNGEARRLAQEARDEYAGAFRSYMADVLPPDLDEDIESADDLAASMFGHERPCGDPESLAELGARIFRR